MINIPLALQPFMQLIRFEDTWKNYQDNPALKNWLRAVHVEPATGDIIYHADSDPAEAMPEWTGPRHVTEVDFYSFQHSIGRYATSMIVDVDDVKAGSANPMKVAAYQRRMQELAKAAFLTPLQLFVRTIMNGNALGAAVNGVTATQWARDGQNIFDNHAIKVGNTSLGNFRNYRSKDATGGGAAFPISVGNETAIFQAGLGFTAPNGINVPQVYNMVLCSPGQAPVLERILHDDRLTAAEMLGQSPLTSAPAGGDVANPLLHYGSKGCQVVPVSGFPTTYRLYLDTTNDFDNAIGFQERQALTWQFKGNNAASAFEGAEDNDAGVVADDTFEGNFIKMGPKWRGAFYFRHWRGMFLADSAP